MLDDIEEIISEAPMAVLGIIIAIVVICVGGSWCYHQYIVGPTPTPAPIITPVPTVTPTPAPTITAKPTPAPEYEYITNDMIPGATFKRDKTGPAGVYYGTFYNEQCVFIDIEKWLAGGGKVIMGAPDGLTVHTRFAMLNNGRYDPKTNRVISLNPDVFTEMLELEKRGWFDL